MTSTILLFVHLVGVALLFVMITIELVAIVAAPRATTIAQLRSATYAAPAIKVLAPVTTLLIVVSGLWLVAVVDWVDWSAGWVITAIVLTVILAVVGGSFQGRHLEELRDTAITAADGPVDLALAGRAQDRAVHLVSWASVAATFGLLWIMTDKPNGVNAIITAIVAPLIGATVGHVLLNQATAGQKPHQVP